MAQRLKLDSIRIDGGTQPRAGIDWDVAYGYGDLIKDGVKFPPVTVFFDGENYWLADGFHRYHGAFSVDVDEVNADVVQGTLEDAQWFSLGANKAHGLMRTNDDKQRAVQAALAHPKCKGMSDRAIAKHVGVHNDTVSQWRKKLSVGFRQIDKPTASPTKKTRTATRNGTTYEINTSNIGRSQASATPKTEAGAQPTPPPNQPQPAPTPEPEQRDSDDLRMFQYHLRGILETQLTDRLLADEIIASPAATQILSLMERVNELLANTQARAAASR